MASRISDRIISLLDWCWPFPLGIAAASLALIMAAGTWLLFHDQRHAPATQHVEPTGPSRLPGTAPANVLPTPQASGELPLQQDEASISTRTPAVDATIRMPARAATASRRQSEVSAQPLTPRATSPARKPVHATTSVEPPATRPNARPSPATAQLSSAQLAEITDHLKIGKFLMGRKDFKAATREFQAVLAIDPSNREAKSAIESAQEADKHQDSTLQP